MNINLSEIMSIKGNIEHIQAPIELKSFCMEGIEYSFAHKSFIDLTLTHLGNRKVKMEGEAKLSLLIPCNRCLEEVETWFDLKISQDLDFNQGSEDRIEELDEKNYINGYNLDVDLLVYNEILINFPMKVLCDEECKGICKVCGTNLNKSSCDCDTFVPDPRMSVIRDIFNNFKEV